jgi:hypothetical protein
MHRGGATIVLRRIQILPKDPPQRSDPHWPYARWGDTLRARAGMRLRFGDKVDNWMSLSSRADGAVE